MKLADRAPNKSVFRFCFSGGAEILVADEDGTNERWIGMDVWLDQLPPLPLWIQMRIRQIILDERINRPLMTETIQ
jgi:hypothetical protein